MATAALLACGLCLGVAHAASSVSMSPAQKVLQKRLTGLGLSGADAGSIVAQAQTRRISPQKVEVWISDMRALAAKGLPPTLMSGLLQEGLAKGVAVPRINSALNTLAQNLIWAKGLLQAHDAVPSGTGTALADRVYGQFDEAMRSGVRRKDLASVLGNRPLQPAQAGSLAALIGDLSSRGLSSARAASLLQQAGVTGLPEKALVHLQQRLDRGLAGTRATPGAVESLLDGTSATALPDTAQGTAGMRMTAGLRTLLNGGTDAVPLAATAQGLLQGTVQASLSGLVQPLVGGTLKGVPGLTPREGANSVQARLARPVLERSLDALPHALTKPRALTLPLLGHL